MSWNPIKELNGAAIRCPSEYEYGWQDVSASDAGRTEDALMHKEKVADKRKLKLSWNNITTDVSEEICKASKDEYFYCTYYDVASGTFEKRYFYRGDVTATLYMTLDNGEAIVSKLSFDLIEV